MSLSVFKKFAKKQTVSDRRSRPVLSRIGRDPRVDWAVMSLVSVLVAISLILVSLFKYSSFEANLDKEVSAIKQKSADSIDTKSLDIVIKKFENRAVQKSTLLVGQIGPSDPAI